MAKGQQVIGNYQVIYNQPIVNYKSTKSIIEALTGIEEGAMAYATDTNELGTYDGASWVWGNLGSTSIVTNDVPSGLVNGSNTIFTFDPFVGGSLLLYRDGQLMTPNGADYTETTPASGIVTFVTAPATSSVILGTYQSAISTTGNADTLDGYHASGIGASHTHKQALWLAAHGLNQTVAGSNWMNTPLYYYGLYTAAYNYSVPRACTIRRFMATTNSTQPATGSLVATIYINNAPSATKVLTWAAGSAYEAKYEDTEVALAGGDVLTVRWTNNATTASAQINYCSIEVLLNTE